MRTTLIAAAIVAALIAAAWLLFHTAILPEGIPPSLQSTCGKLETFKARMACVDAASAKAEAPLMGLLIDFSVGASIVCALASIACALWRLDGYLASQAERRERINRRFAAPWGADQ